MRQVTAEMRAALIARRVPKALFVDFDHPAQREFLWNGLGRVRWGGREWVGVGDLARISGLSQTSDLGVQRVNFDLMRVEQADIDRMLQYSVAGREVVLYLGIVNDGVVIPDPIRRASFELSTTRVETDTDGNRFLRFTGLTGIWAMEKPIRRALTDEEQQKEFPGDTGYSLVAEQQSKTYNWRRV